MMRSNVPLTFVNKLDLIVLRCCFLRWATTSPSISTAVTSQAPEARAACACTPEPLPMSSTRFPFAYFLTAFSRRKESSAGV